ncbi:MAG: glycosyltransferase family 2 protein [Tannerellaceae bacterium]|jgi:glycosyltransferase involved in cell wall biosynthesis|nr:glycosyltransferase family 2 protein [Tannerellaceae bacterium]
MIKTSLLISTYNWKEALHLSLSSAFKQAVLPCEILVADDGSRDDTRRLIDGMREISPVPIVHVWHEDTGFRLAGIRNKAIAQASGDYIIQIDGDIVMKRYFISDHLDLAERGYFICGSRVRLSPRSTQRLLEKGSEIGRFQEFNINNLRSKIIRHYLADRYAKGNIMRLRGCNMSFWREDLIAINGYNEQFTSWGHEDAELAYRLFFSGIQKRYLKMGGVAYHLDHPFNSREKEREHFSIVEQLKEAKTSWVEDGIDKYLRVEN